MYKIISFFKKAKEHILILFLYTVITLVMFYPVTFNFFSSFAGIGVDVLPNAWSLWLPRTFMYDIKNLAETDFLAYPNTGSLFVNGCPFLNLLISYPVTWIMGITFTYNLNIFLSCIITGYTTFLLAKYLTQDTCSSFIAGLIFAFCPFRLFRIILGHTVLLRTEFMPIYIIILLKFIKDVNLKNSLLVALFFTINIYNSIYMAIMSGFFSLVIIMYNIRIIFKVKNLKYIILIIFLAGILSFPYIYAFSSEGERYFSFNSLSFSSDYSADLMSFISPSSFNPFWGEKLKRLNVDFNRSEHFLGYTVIIILIYGFIRVKKERFWLVAAMIFLLISMGPTLKIMGKTGESIFYFPVDDLKVTVPLPYIILYYCFPVIRNPGRFTLLTVLSMAIFVSFSLKEFFSKTCYSKILITVLLTVFILIEFSITMPLIDSKVPQIYYSIGKEKEDFTVLDIPVFIADGWHHIGVYNHRTMYYQTVHNKKILNAYLGRLPDSFFYYYSNIPVIGTIIALEENRKIEKNRMELDRIWLQRVLYFFNIKYIVLQPPFNHNSAVKDYIGHMMKLKAINKDIPEVYEVFGETPDLSSVNIDIQDPGSLLYMPEGWEWAENNGDFYYKSNLKKTVIMVPLSNDFAYRMSLTIAATGNSYVTVILNGRKIARLNLTEDPGTYKIDLSGHKFNRLNKFEIIQDNFIKEKSFVKVRKIIFSKK
ncbi:MAG: hypothetical protein ABRQ38_11815 [Candidatus Eremiobacterota bacterium]